MKPSRKQLEQQLIEVTNRLAELENSFQRGQSYPFKGGFDNGVQAHIVIGKGKNVSQVLGAFLDQNAAATCSLENSDLWQSVETESWVLQGSYSPDAADFNPFHVRWLTGQRVKFVDMEHSQEGYGTIIGDDGDESCGIEKIVYFIRPDGYSKDSKPLAIYGYEIQYLMAEL